MVFLCRREDLVKVFHRLQRPTHTYTGCGGSCAHLSSPLRAVFTDKSLSRVWQEEWRSTSSSQVLLLWPRKCLKTGSRSRCHPPLVSVGWSCWKTVQECPPSSWLTGSTGSDGCEYPRVRPSVRARAPCVYLCVVFICVVRIGRAAFSQEPAWAQWAQSAAPGPVINAASGDWKTAGWKGFSSLQHPT